MVVLKSERSWAIDLRVFDEVRDSVVEHMQDSKSIFL